MSRHVVIRVDEGAERLSVWHWAGPDAHGPLSVEHVPVPQDDQLTREIEATCNDMEDRAHNLRIQADLFDELSPTRRKKQFEADTLERRVECLRAAFHLDEEE